MRSENVPYPGTMIRGGMNFKRPMILEEALKFSGQKYAPSAASYVQNKYEDEKGDLIIYMKKEFKHFGSREIGQAVKTKLHNIINVTQGEHVTLDLSDITIISSSFADEVFGRLFVELGPIRFMRAVRFVNVEPSVAHLIDRAIKQRTSSEHLGDVPHILTTRRRSGPR